MWSTAFEPGLRNANDAGSAETILKWLGLKVWRRQLPVKVPITPKAFFRLNKSLHLFETHTAFLPLFNPNIDLLQAVKVTKSGHHLSHDRASKGYGSFLVWRHKLLCMHVYKDLIRCKSVCDIKQRIDSCPLLARSCDRWWQDFVTFTA